MAHALTPVPAGTLGGLYGRFILRAMAGATVWVGLYLVVGSLAGSAAGEHHQLIVLLAAAVVVAAVVLMAERVVRTGAEGPSRREPSGPARTDRSVAP